MRSTFATRVLQAGISVFDLAHIMGTSVLMIERHYGAFLTDSLTSARVRLTSFEVTQQATRTERSGSPGSV